MEYFVSQQPALLFFLLRFGCMTSGPKSYRDFGETPLARLSPCQETKYFAASYIKPWGINITK